MKTKNVFVITGFGFAGFAIGFAACKFWETVTRKREAKRRKKLILKWCSFGFGFVGLINSVREITVWLF